MGGRWINGHHGSRAARGQSAVLYPSHVKPMAALKGVLSLLIPAFHPPSDLGSCPPSGFRNLSWDDEALQAAGVKQDQ